MYLCLYVSPDLGFPSNSRLTLIEIEVLTYLLNIIRPSQKGISRAGAGVGCCNFATPPQPKDPSNCPSPPHSSLLLMRGQKLIVLSHFIIPYPHLNPCSLYNFFVFFPVVLLGADREWTLDKAVFTYVHAKFVDALCFFCYQVFSITMYVLHSLREPCDCQK